MHSSWRCESTGSWSLLIRTQSTVTSDFHHSGLGWFVVSRWFLGIPVLFGTFLRYCSRERRAVPQLSIVLVPYVPAATPLTRFQAFPDLTWTDKQTNIKIAKYIYKVLCLLRAHIVHTRTTTYHIVSKCPSLCKPPPPIFNDLVESSMMEL